MSLSEPQSLHVADFTSHTVTTPRQQTEISHMKIQEEQGKREGEMCDKGYETVGLEPPTSR